ncbi:MAG: hypothetical protein R2873_21320 [Caldilineaceae bacterium]
MSVAAASSPSHFDLRVEISLPERWPDFAGIPITLVRQDAIHLTQETAQSGTVIFSDLSLAEIESARLLVDLG